MCELLRSKTRLIQIARKAIFNKMYQKSKRRQGCRPCILGKSNARAFCEAKTRRFLIATRAIRNHYSHPNVAGGLLVASK